MRSTSLLCVQGTYVDIERGFDGWYFAIVNEPRPDDTTYPTKGEAIQAARAYVHSWLADEA